MDPIRNIRISVEHNEQHVTLLWNDHLTCFNNG